MGLDVVPGEHLEKFLFLVEDHVQKERGAAKLHPFDLVFINRVSFELPDFRPRLQHEGMVAADGFVGSNAREHGLAAAAKAGKVMMDDAARAYDVVGCHYPFVKRDSGSPRGGPHVLELIRVIGVGIVHVDPPGDP